MKNMHQRGAKPHFLKSATDTNMIRSLPKLHTLGFAAFAESPMLSAKAGILSAQPRGNPRQSSLGIAGNYVNFEHILCMSVC
jgi:hypothetical protein